MSVPTAVSPGAVTPGLYLVIDLLAGTSSPNSGELRVALIASKSSGGNLTNDTEVRSGGGEDTASVAFGPGSLGHLGAKVLYRRFPGAQVDFISPVPGASTATLNLTVSGAPTGATSILMDVHGRQWEVAWEVGETPAQIATKIINSILQRTTDLAVTSVTGGTGIATINSKVAGRIGNDVKVKAVLSKIATGSEAIAGALVYTNLSGGTTDPDLTNALAALQGKEYAFILPALSNTDVVNTGTKSNVSRIVDHINARNYGLNAKLQQLVVGCTSTISAAKAASSHANGAQNAEEGEILLCVNGRSLPIEFGAREVGGWLLGLSADPAINRIGELLDGVVGSADKITDMPTLAQSEDALGNGVSLVSYTAQGLEYLVRPVTTHSQDSSGAPDRRLLDVQNVSATYIVGRDLRSAIPTEFPNAKITKDTEPGEDPPPKGVIEERDLKAFCIARLRFWQTQGVITKASLDASIEDETLIVMINASDATQVDVVLPFKIVPPLAKVGVVVQRQPA